VKHLHTPLPCLVSSLHLFCLCLIGPRSTLDQHRRLISPPGNTSTLTISLRDLSTLECLHYLSFHLVPPSDRVRCMSVLIRMQLRITSDTIDNSNTVSYTHHTQQSSHLDTDANSANQRSSFPCSASAPSALSHLQRHSFVTRQRLLACFCFCGG
jgi:hypothetical protein